MEFYDKFVERFQDISKVWSPVVSKGLAITQSLQNKMFLGNMMLSRGPYFT